MPVKGVKGIVKLGQILTTICQYMEKCTYFCTRKL